MTLISVFGGSAPPPDSAAYREAHEVGGALAGAGYTVMSGGYGGTMAAVSQGAQAAGGHTIGVTVGLFEDQYGIRPNPYLAEVIRYDDLTARLMHLVARCDGAVVLKGGVGTLSELTLMWSLMQVGEIALKPLVLVGPGWGHVLAAYRAESYAKPRDFALLNTVDRADEVVPALTGWFADPPALLPRLSGG